MLIKSLKRVAKASLLRLSARDMSKSFAVRDKMKCKKLILKRGVLSNLEACVACHKYHVTLAGTQDKNQAENILNS